MTANRDMRQPGTSDKQRLGSRDPADAPLPVASFARSLVPMVIADDGRRFVAANAAACLLLRLPEEELLRLSVDDLTPPEGRGVVASLWEAFIRHGTQQGRYELLAPDGAKLTVDYSATANIAPGQHLSILMFPAAGANEGSGSNSPVVLSAREREVLGLVAMGHSSGEIATALVLATSTVETHVRRCMDKLGARNRAHAIALALARGEIALELQSVP